jgi:hypothetical protein
MHFLAMRFTERLSCSLDRCDEYLFYESEQQRPEVQRVVAFGDSQS